MVLVADLSERRQSVLQIMRNLSNYKNEYIKTERLAAFVTNPRGPMAIHCDGFRGAIP
jgi:hypothetical protein